MHSTLFDNQPIRCGLSERVDGSMLLPERSRSETTQRNRENFFRRQGFNASRVVSPLLVHANGVACVSEAHCGTTIRDVDGLITQSPDVFLTVTVADCLPVLFFAPKARTVGMVHAGWRGLAAHVIAAALDALQHAAHVQPSDVLAVVGPSIGPCHYEVGEDVAGRFRGYADAVHSRDGRFFLDLRTVALQQLLEHSVQRSSIDIDPACTFEDTRFFSARRDRSDPVDVMVAYCCLTPARTDKSEAA